MPKRTSPIRWRRLTLGVAACTAFAGVAVAADLAPTASPAQLPALVSPPTGDRRPGKIVFAELVTPDLASVQPFYASLFGWTFQEAQSGETKYAQASLDGRPVAGLLQRPMPSGRHPGWLTFIAAGDLGQVDAAAVQQGAKVLFAPHRFANLGQEAVLADPQGAVFAVLASTSGDPPDFLAAPGEWIWSSLITTDPETDAAFYKALLGYDVVTLPDSADTHHLLLAAEGYARASVNPIPASHPDAHPRWISYLRVTDATAMTARVTSLGGRVLVPPRQDRQGGRLAIVADPQGALFGLMEWSDASTTNSSAGASP